MERIGLIGIGNIGKYFVRKLLDAGYPLTVLDKDRDRASAAVDLGAEAADTPGDLAERSGIVIFALPGTPPVENVMDGQDGVLAHLAAGKLVIDTGTTRPETDVRYEGLCREKGAGFLDAPITWRKDGLIFMVGGTAESFERGKGVLTCLAYKLRHVGSIGKGQVLKFMNQMVLAGQLAVLAETIEYGKKADVDPRLLSEYLEFQVGDALYGDDFSGTGTLALHYKDLGYILDLAHDTGAHVPIASIVHEAFKAAHIHGHPNWTQPGIITYWRRANEGR